MMEIDTAVQVFYSCEYEIGKKLNLHSSLFFLLLKGNLVLELQYLLIYVCRKGYEI
jgi:hypothetical protein